MLQPHISHQFNSPVWRLEIDSLSDTIFTEIREASDKRVSFASISLETGKTWFEDLQTEDRWLTGIAAAYDGVLLLHNYQSESGPAHKGLVALDAYNGSVLWQNFNYAFDHLTINGPIFYDARVQPRRLLLADIKTGATVRGYEPSIDLELTNYLAFPAEAPAEYMEALHLPVRPLENTAYYLEHNEWIIVSLHAIAEGAPQQHLYILRGSELVYEDLLNTGIQKLQPESFLMHKDQLICLKNLSQLKVFKL